MKSLQLPLCMNINYKPSTSSIPRKSTLLKSSGVSILCRTTTRRVCMVSDGSGLLARRVLKHCPVLALVLIADPRSDRSQVQSSKAKVQSSFSSTTGKGHTTRLLAQTLVGCIRGFPPGRSRISSQNIFQ